MDKEIICATCGTGFPSIEATAGGCPICNDDRQYVPPSGQSWTTHDELANKYGVMSRKLGESLYELTMTPLFAIGQRAFLIQSPGGNILWDCIPLLSESTVDFIKAKGGLKAIAFSHPHFYSTMSRWAETFDCPIYIHESDRGFIVNNSSRIELWSGAEKHLWDGIRLINVGGHFPGSSILHVPFLSPGGTVLCGDTFVLSPSMHHLAAMHSYPNRIPLPLEEIRRIEKVMEPTSFDAIHGWNESQSINSDAKSVMKASFERYS